MPTSLRKNQGMPWRASASSKVSDSFLFWNRGKLVAVNLRRTTRVVHEGLTRVQLPVRSCMATSGGAAIFTVSVVKRVIYSRGSVSVCQLWPSGVSLHQYNFRGRWFAFLPAYCKGALIMFVSRV